MEIVGIGKSKRKFPMKPVMVLATCLFATALFSQDARGQTPLVGPNVTGACGVLDSTCESLDSSFSPTSITISQISFTKAFLITCRGETANPPAKRVRCINQGLYRPFVTPSFPDASRIVALVACGTQLGVNAFSNDHFYEDISPTGEVVMQCEFGGNDTDGD
jgi:hypothetical protein